MGCKFIGREFIYVGDLEAMRERSTSFTTSKRNRVYRRASIRNGETHYANNYTLRVKQDGKPYYFNLGADKRQAGPLADKIVDFLRVEGNTADEALLKYSKSHRQRAARNTKRKDLGLPLHCLLYTSPSPRDRG